MEGASGDRVGPSNHEDGRSAPTEVARESSQTQAQSALGFDVEKSPSLTASQLLSKNLQATITYCSVFWSFGMCVALLGPTIEDLGCQTSSTLADMSWAFLSQSLCTLIGSMVGGILVDSYLSQHNNCTPIYHAKSAGNLSPCGVKGYQHSWHGRWECSCCVDRLPADPMLLCSTSIIAVTIALIPFCHSLNLLLIDMAVMGIFMGIIDTIANVSLLKIYGKLVSPFLQALHFCYGLGAFISPIVAEPFLLNTDCSMYIEPNGTDNNLLSPMRRDLNPTTPAPRIATESDLEQAQEKTRVRYAFWIMATIQLPIVFMVLLLLCKKTCLDPILGRGQASTLLVNRALYEDLDKDAETKEKTFADGHIFSSKKIVLIIFLICVILFLYDGLQAGYGGFIFAYAVRNSHIDVSASDGAYMTSVYWGSFALGRLLSIPISTRCSLPLMLFCNLLGCLIAMSVEVIFHDSLATLYIASAIFGVSLSSIYPTSIALAEHNVSMNGFVTSCLVIAAASGEMTFPILFGRVLFPIRPTAFLIFSLTMTVFGLFIYSALFATTSCSNAKATNAVKNIPVAENALVWCRRNCCLTQSRESLLPGESNYYTTLSDTTNAYKIVESPEQIAMAKVKESAEDNHNAVSKGEMTNGEL